MSIKELVLRQQKIEQNIWRVKNELKKGDKPHLETERKQRLTGYEKELKETDSAKECLMTVEINEKDHTYRINQIQVLTRKGKSLEKKKIKEEFGPIPPKTFVAVLEKEIQAWGMEQTKEPVQK